MRSSFLFLLASLATAASLFASDITPEDAAKHVGEKVSVRGTVVQTTLSKAIGAPGSSTRNGYLNFGAKYPNQVLTIAVLGQKTPALLSAGTGWLTDLQGKEVVVTGTVELYEGKPQIVIAAREDVVAK